MPPVEVGKVGQEKSQNAFLGRDKLPKNTKIAPIMELGKNRFRSQNKVREAMFLRIPVTMPDRTIREFEFLVDTGAEVNLLNKNLIAEENWVKAGKKLRLVSATDTPLQGGDRYCRLQMEFLSVPVGAEETGHTVVGLEGEFYEGDIFGVEGILAHKWLVDNNLAVFPHRGCLMLEGEVPQWLFGGELEMPIEDWEGLPRSRNILHGKGRREEKSVDDLSDQDFYKVLKELKWSVPPVMTPEQALGDMPQEKRIRRVRILEEIQGWGMKPTNDKGEPVLSFDELLEVAGYMAEEEEDQERKQGWG